MGYEWIIPAVQTAASIGDRVSARTSGAAKGAADERTQQNDYRNTTNRAVVDRYGTQQNALLQALINQDRGRTERYGTQQGATTSALANQSQENIQRARLGLDAPGIRARQSVLGSLMQNLQPVNVQASSRVAPHVPRISGGLTPATLDPLTRQHGGELMKAALQAQLSGSDIPAATNFMGGVLGAPAETDFRSGLLAPPELQGYQDAGRGESLLSGTSLVTGLLSDLAGTVGRNRTPRDRDVYAGDVGPTQDLDPDRYPRDTTTGDDFMRDYGYDPYEDEDFMADYG